MKWDWWVRNVLHIETLFILFVVVIVSYVLVTGKDLELPLDAQVRDAYEETRDIDPKLFKKRKKRAKTTKRSNRPILQNIYANEQERLEAEEYIPRGKRVNKFEEECRRIFEGIFNKKFVSIRPGWLKNPVTGSNLEIDGFNPDIVTPKGKGLGFEYDGEQHSRFNQHFHRGDVKAFEYQQVKDSFKDKVCREKGVLLIRIPHFIIFDDLEKYIRLELTRNGMGRWLVR